VLENLALREPGDVKGGNKRGLYWKSWVSERLMLEKVALEEVSGGRVAPGEVSGGKVALGKFCSGNVTLRKACVVKGGNKRVLC